ncbi:hypothetical protein C8F04DRAFT_371011 [Mycena alexandri]|uniref:Uncharacterized protein n=1 Tax=Mycena alexandri TaxID=1745969 RepID=A0AAD6T2M4_9AGAR|nr:hypothetical protein C8F04DRAFT_371011 [Mycena alexandri]
MAAKKHLVIPVALAGPVRPCRLEADQMPQEFHRCAPVGSDSALSLLSYYMNEPPRSSHRVPPSPSSSVSPPATPTPVPSLCRTVVGDSSSSPTSPTRSSAYPSTPKKSRIDQPHSNRLSALSIASLPFPLPTPPGLASDPEWEVDPFACPPYSSTSSPPPSKWSPASSTQSLAHYRSHSTDAMPKRDLHQKTFGKLKGDIASPTKLKDFFGRLSMNRSPGTSGFHFRSASASVSTNKDGDPRGKKRRPDSLMTFVDEGKEDELTEDISPRNDGADIFETSTRSSISQVFNVAEQNVCVVIPDPVRSNEDETKWKTSQVKAPVGPTTTVTAASAVSVITKYTDVTVSEDSSMISASIQSPFSGRLHVPASPSPKMRKPVPNLSPTSSNLPRSLPSPRNLINSPSKPRGIAIPPSPRTPPPHPPNRLPSPYAADSVSQVLDLGFPSPPLLADHLVPASPGRKSKIQAGNMALPSPTSRRLPQPPSSPVSPLQVQKPSSARGSVSVNQPPAVPPRSKLRPPPVKITTDFSPIRRTIVIQGDVPGQCDVSPLKIASPAHSHSSSVASLTISPMPTPPHSPSALSSKFPKHFHSTSLSSSLAISPMPTPPPLSPTSPPASAPSTFGSLPPIPTCPRPPAPEPQIDMGALRTLILQRGDHKSNEGDSDSESEDGEALKAIIQRISGDEHEHEDSLIATSPEFAWPEEPRSPPSRMSLHEPERNLASSDIEDDAVSIYSQFSSTYTFRSRSSSTRRKRSIRRNGKGGRLSRRMTAMSMMSVYSQGSFCAGDAIDLPSVPTLPWDLERGSTGGAAEEPLPDETLGEMTFEAPEYAYAFSWDDYVVHGLEGVALAGRTPIRSGADFETAIPSRLPVTKSHFPTAKDPAPDDWRALLTVQDKEKSKRRTSSNISVVGNILPNVQDPEIAVYTRHPFADASSLATNGSVGDISTTSVSSISAQALLPNRRKKTVRRVAAGAPSPPFNYQPPASSSVNLIFDAEAKNGGSPRETRSPRAAFPFVDGDDKQTRSVRSGLRGMKSRVNVLTSRLVSLTIASSRSSSSHIFPSRRGADSYDRRPHPSSAPYFEMGAASSWPSTSVSPSSSTSSASAGSAGNPPSSTSSWTPGLANRDALFLSRTATPSTAPMAI